MTTYSPRHPVLVLVAFVSVLCTASHSHAQWPAWVESWLFNPEERTERAVDGFESGDLESATPSFETALRLDPTNPTAQFNAGTSRLASGNADPTELLSTAAASTSADLAAAASYNLGNAHLARDAYSEAIESYKSALRSSPGMTDAKFNLELAKKRLREQQQNQDSEEGQEGDEGQEGEQQEQDNDQSDQESNEQDQQDQQNQQGQQEQQDQQDGEQQDQQDQQNGEQEQQDQQDGEQGEQNSPQQSGQQQESPLPQFTDLEDMTAEEAAAILEAVENLEREQRRQEALAAAQANVGGKKDW